MAYKTAYKVLNQSRTIDTIINEETQQGENLNIVKKEIIDGIQYFTSFIKESSFRKRLTGGTIPKTFTNALHNGFAKN